MRLDDAELVAVGIGQHDVPLLGALPDVHLDRPQVERLRNHSMLVGSIRAGQVQVSAVLRNAVLAAAVEGQPHLRG